MKKFILFILVSVVSIVAVRAQKVQSADEILKQAYQQAAKDNKKVFVIFHASWCVWCRKMDSSIHDASVRPIFDKNYVIVHLTVQETPDKKNLENPGAAEFLAKHGGEGQGLPFWLILDKTGNTMADAFVSPGVNSGCPASKEEVQHFVDVLSRTATMTPEQRTAVEKRFRKNDVN